MATERLNSLMWFAHANAIPSQAKNSVSQTTDILGLFLSQLACS